MNLSHYKFDLPNELIAIKPSKRKLMVVGDSIRHMTIPDLLKFDIDLVVYNDSKVVPSVLNGKRVAKNGDTPVEVILLKNLYGNVYDTITNPSNSIKVEDVIKISKKCSGEVIDRTTPRARTIAFNKDNMRSRAQVMVFKYSDYSKVNFSLNTVDGSIVATGNRLNKITMLKMKLQNTEFIPITAHLDLGSIRPILTDDLSRHNQDFEWIDIKNVEKINNSKNRLVMGTNVLRFLEGSIEIDGQVREQRGLHNSFIYYPHTSVFDYLLCQFHFPCSLQMITAAAFAGYERLMEAYRIGVEKGYTWGPWGDSVLFIK